MGHFIPRCCFHSRYEELCVCTLGCTCVSMQVIVTTPEIYRSHDMDISIHLTAHCSVGSQFPTIATITPCLMSIIVGFYSQSY